MNLPWEHFDRLEPGQLVRWEPRYDGHPRDKLEPGEIWTVIDRRTADDGATVVQFQRQDGKREHRAVTGHGVLLVSTVGEHHAVCCVCSQPWPCAHHRMDQAAAAYAHQLNDACVACGMTDGVRWGTVRRELGNGEVSEERYHTRKGSPCRRAYLRLIAGDERALTALRLDDGDVTALRGRATR